ncbi:MAG: FMN-binding negative transcriptional regulator [Comamonadaceae bacterium]|nr:FMN-binding negative transcriptional regulator [Comamonadaceae bacterium]
MYAARALRAGRSGRAADLIARHPLATLVGRATRALTADHVPLEFHGAAARSRGHVTRPTALVWRGADGPRCWPSFQGADAYVSPAWYPSKAATAQGGADLELRRGACPVAC